MILNQKELINIYGGLSISNTLFSTILKFVNFTLDLGKTVGSVIRRGKEKTFC